MRKMRPRSRAVKKSEESQRVLDALDAYLEGNIDEPVRWLVRFWKDQAAVMLYRELRELVIGETDPESLFDIWFQDYSKMLSEKMTPVWEQAFLEGWKNNSLFCGAEDVISSESWVRSWIVDHTGDLITNCCNEQVSAIRYLIAEAESLNMSSAETARYIRPTIGLTERQAAANLKYYNSIKERLTTDHPRMKPESIERKAREAASKYAERQQRYRAETIARSEIAQAYNHGADAFVREAVTAGNLPEMEKEWSTALNGHVCASCAALEGTKIGMDDEFKTVSGRREITTSSGNKNSMIDLTTIVGMHYFIQLILYFFKSLNSKELVAIVDYISCKEKIVYSDFKVLFNASLKLLFQDKKIVKITGEPYSSYKLTNIGYETIKLMINDCICAGVCDRIRVELMHKEFYKLPHS